MVLIIIIIIKIKINVLVVPISYEEITMAFVWDNTFGMKYVSIFVVVDIIGPI